MLGIPNTTNSPTFTHTEEGAGDAVAIVRAAADNVTHVLLWLTASYDGDSAGSTITVSVGADTVWEHYIDNNAIPDVWHFTFPGGLYGTPGAALTVTLGAVASRTGRLTIATM